MRTSEDKAKRIIERTDKIVKKMRRGKNCCRHGRWYGYCEYGCKEESK